MKKYVVAFISFFDNEIVQKIVHANTNVHACLQIMGANNFDTTDEEILTVKDIQNIAFSGDCMISVIEIK